VIETHGMSTQGQRLPSAMELSLHKVQRERQMAQALIEQRQLSSNYSLNVCSLCLFVSYLLMII
jgi:chromatin modification-related protein VID21